MLLRSRALLLAGVLLACAVPARSLPVRGLDHVIIVVRDLDAAAARFERLGFTLKDGRVHPDGLRNRHVKFADGAEIELLTAPAAAAAGDGP